MASSSQDQSSSRPPPRPRTKRMSFEAYELRTSLYPTGKGGIYSFRDSLTSRPQTQTSLDKEVLTPALSVESSTMLTLVSTSTAPVAGEDPFGFEQAERQYKQTEGKQLQESPLARFDTCHRNSDHGPGPLALLSSSTTPTSTGSAGSVPRDNHPSPGTSPLALRTRRSSQKRLSDTALHLPVKSRSYSSARYPSLSEVGVPPTFTQDDSTTGSPRRSQRIQARAYQPTSTTILPTSDDSSTVEDSNASPDSSLPSQEDSPITSAHPTNIFEDDRLLSNLGQYDKLLAFDPTTVNEIPRRRGTSLLTKTSTAVQRKSKGRTTANQAPGHRGRSARRLGKTNRSRTNRATENTDGESAHDGSENENQNQKISEYTSKLKKQFEEIDAYELAEEVVI
ncbi:hypothetical protein IWQ61_005722 [Dispira simplex]|nr:hypothetical protein IWQ61_005722 [Dispira simplex]